MLVVPHESKLQKRCQHLSNSTMFTHTRELRGTGNQVAVKETVKIPKNFQKFLAHDKNKEQLFALLARNLAKVQIDEKTVISTTKEKVLVSSTSNVQMTSSSHEEADAILLLHAERCPKLPSSDNNENSGFRRTHYSTVCFKEHTRTAKAVDRVRNREKLKIPGHPYFLCFSAKWNARFVTIFSRIHWMRHGVDILSGSGRKVRGKHG